MSALGGGARWSPSRNARRLRSGRHLRSSRRRANIFATSPDAAASAASAAAARPFDFSPAAAAARRLDFYDGLRSDAEPARGPDGRRRVDLATATVEDERGTTTATYDLRHLVAVLPLTDDGYDGGFNFAGAVLLALKHFNRGVSDLVPQIAGADERCPGLKFTAEFAASGFIPSFNDPDPPRTVAEAGRVLTKDILPRRNDASDVSRPFPTALLVGDWADVTDTIAILSEQYEIPNLSNWHIDNSVNMRFQSQILAKTSLEVEAAVDFMQSKFGITHFGVLIKKGSSYLDYEQATLRAANQFGITAEIVAFDYTYSYDSDYDEEKNMASIRKALGRLQRTGYRYFFAYMGGGYDGVYGLVLNEARKFGIVGPQNFWVLSDFGGELHFEEDLYKETNFSVAEAANGVAVMTAGFWVPIVPDSFMSHWESLLTTEARRYLDSKMPPNITSAEGYNSTVFAGFQEDSDSFGYVSLMYECTVALALAACDAAMRERFFGPEDLFDSLMNTSFEGPYHETVVFDPMTGNRHWRSMPFRVANIVFRPPDENGTVHSQWTEVYELQRSFGDPGNIAWTKINGSTDFVFFDNGTTPPATLPPIEYQLIEEWALPFGIAMCALSLTLSLGFGVWTTAARKTHVVASAQPLFLGMLCSGTFIMGTAIIPLSLQWPMQGLDEACMSIPWLFFVGFVVSFSALFSKTKRLNELTRRSHQLKRVTVKAQDVMVPFAVLFTLSIAVLVAWTVVSPLKYQPVDLIQDKYGRNLVPGACFQDRNSYDKLFFTLLAVIDFIAVAYACLQAYKSKDVPTEFNESRFIFLSLVLVLESFVILVPFLIAFKSLTARYCVFSILLAVTCSAVLLPIFVPKLIRQSGANARRKARDEKKRLRETRLYEQRIRESTEVYGTLSGTAATQELTHRRYHLSSLGSIHSVDLPS